MNIFKNLFQEEKPLIQELQDKSANILTIFTSTTNELREINSTIQQEVIMKHKEIESLQQEIDSLDTLRVSNAKVVDKITAFLND